MDSGTELGSEPDSRCGAGMHGDRSESTGAAGATVAAIPTPRIQLPAVLPAVPTAGRSAGASRRSRQERYDDLVVRMKRAYGVRVVKWRSSMSGCAWAVEYRDGTIARLIESPYPRGPMSAAIFLHEIGHHAIGLATYSPRCLEEFHAWRFSFEAMEANDVSITDRVRARRDDALRYAVAKAVRRGLKRLPIELEPWLPTGVTLARAPERA